MAFFSSRLVCRTSDSSYNLTDSSLVKVDFQQSFVAFDFLVCSKTADHIMSCQAYTHTLHHVTWHTSHVMLHHHVESYN